MFASVPTAKQGPFWRKLLAFLGPGYLVAVGYMGRKSGVPRSVMMGRSRRALRDVWKVFDGRRDLAPRLV